MSTMDKKTKQIVIYAIGAVVFVGVIFWGFVGKNSDSDSQGFSSSVLATTENTFDFGTISINGGNVSHEFVVINDGTNPVVVEKVYTTCGCTTAILTDASNKEYRPRRVTHCKSDIRPRSSWPIWSWVSTTLGLYRDQFSKIAKA